MIETVAIVRPWKLPCVETIFVRCGRAGDDRLVAPRELERALVRLRARVAEEHAVGERALGDRLRGEDLLVVVVEVRDVDELAELLGDARGERRVRVAEAAHRDARGHVEVARAGDVPDLAAPAALEHDRLLACSS